MKHKPPILWQVLAEEYEQAAEEYYGLWMDCVYAECKPEADCEYDHYLESLRVARCARRKVRM